MSFYSSLIKPKILAILLTETEWLYSHSPEEEVRQYHLNRFTNPYFVSKFINQPVTSQVVIEIANASRQADDIYQAYKHVSLLSKPILLLYSFEKLAKTLILTKNANPPDMRSHGVHYRENRITVNQNGQFRYFHDCYSTDNSIYEKKYAFRTEDLVKNLPIRENDINGIFLREGESSLITKVHHDSSHLMVPLHELDREFLFVFTLSGLARYDTFRWSNLLDGKESDLIIDIQRYLKCVEIFFPILVASYLYNRKIIAEFYPVAVTEL